MSRVQQYVCVCLTIHFLMLRKLTYLRLSVILGTTESSKLKYMYTFSNIRSEVDDTEILLKLCVFTVYKKWEAKTTC